MPPKKFMLKKMRSEMDVIDRELLEIIIRRLQKTDEILEYKSKTQKPLKNKKREKEILEKQFEYLSSKKMLKYKKEIKKIYQLIFSFT